MRSRKDMNNRSVALLLQLEGRRDTPSCSCRSLCAAVLPIKTQFIDMQSFVMGMEGEEPTQKILFVSSSQSFVPPTLSNCFPGLQVATPIFIITRLNYLMHYLFSFLSRNSGLFFLSFLTQGVFVSTLVLAH